MAKIKYVSSYDGSAWQTPVPLGADDVNIDITSSTSNPSSDTDATLNGLTAADVTVSSSYNDTNASAWTKFNRFRKRVYNNLSNTIKNTGGTITGNLIIQATDFPANNTGSPSLLFKDSSNTTWGYVHSIRNNADTRGGTVISGGYKSQDANQIGLLTNKSDNTPFVYLSSPEAWRTALGAPFAINYGGTGASDRSAALNNLGTLNFGETCSETQLAENTNIDTDLVPGVTYQCGRSADAAKLKGTVPPTNSGFKIIQFKSYSGLVYSMQFAFAADRQVWKRYMRNVTVNGQTTQTWTDWHYIFDSGGIVPIANGGTGMATLFSTTTVDNIIQSTTTGWEVDQAWYNQWGHVAQLRIRAVPDHALQGTQETICTVKSSLYPCEVAPGATGLRTNPNIDILKTGAIRINVRSESAANIPALTPIYIQMVYITATAS